jgi:hypothetical protein
MNLQDVPSSLSSTHPSLAPSTCISHRHTPLKRSSPSSKICGPSRMEMERHGVRRSYTNLIRYIAKLRSGHRLSRLLHLSTSYRQSTHLEDDIADAQTKSRGAVSNLRPILFHFDFPRTPRKHLARHTPSTGRCRSRFQWCRSSSSPMWSAWELCRD